MKKQQITTCQQDKRVRHGGDIYRNPVRYDFSINLNPLGMPEGVKRRLKETVEDWGRYPDPQCEALTRALADYHQIAADRRGRSYLWAGADHKAKAGTFAFTWICGV